VDITQRRAKYFGILPKRRTEMIKFTVYGDPIAQGRPKFTTVSGHAKAYDPKKSRSYKSIVYGEALKVKPAVPFEKPLEVTIKIFRFIPKSFSQKKRKLAENCVIRPTTKPDVSNVCKSIEDALNGLIWKDDSQIVHLVVQKFYGEVPRVEIEVSEQ
jgi:Holliday junction resolvase RusA-like endonuclease